MQVAFFVLEIKTMKDLVLNQVTMTSREIADLTGKRQTNKITYVLKKKGTNMVKIGRTKNLAGRLRVLRTMSGCELEIIFTYAGDIELFLHTKFAHLRKIGEWFEDTNKDIEGFLSKDVNKLTFLNIENSTQKVKLNVENIVATLDNKFFKLEEQQQKTQPTLLDTARNTFDNFLYFAKMFGLEGNEALLSADKATERHTGFSPMRFMQIELKKEE